jgi:AraC-like DNA-binding protein
MRLARLREVRRALTERDAPVTVTDVAVRFGFYELGRFAAAYRQAFGEVPSETLRAGRQRGTAGSGSLSPRE